MISSSRYASLINSEINMWQSIRQYNIYTLQWAQDKITDNVSACSETANETSYERYIYYVHNRTVSLLN